MFTGLIQSVCSVVSAVKNADSLTLTVDLEKLAGQVKIGDSVAVNGVCLTAVKIRNPNISFDVSSETLAKSSLAKLTSSAKVNIELAMKPDQRFGGHFVLGHADGTAAIRSVNSKNNFWDFEFTTEPELLSQLVPKGSVALDGISLTIAQLNLDSFTVAIIPETWNNTTLKYKKPNDQLNIEIDIITKTIKQQLDNMLGNTDNPTQDSLTIEKLKNLGF
jgi:riboflavin synthase